MQQALLRVGREECDHSLHRAGRRTELSVERRQRRRLSPKAKLSVTGRGYC
jgi:hypothetical protein